MSTPLLTRLKSSILTLWAQLDVEKRCLSLGSCRRLLEELKELLEVQVPVGYVSSIKPLGEAVEMLEATTSSKASLSLIDVTSLATLFNQSVALLVSPLPPSTIYDPSRPSLPSEIISLIFHQLAAEEECATSPPAASSPRASSLSPEKPSTTRCISPSRLKSATSVATPFPFPIACDEVPT
ncbi:hypothetical protein BCR35DRAFT_115758 [Leucosporidium creatinivorum]|uniref:Uncharacterized protein n=1 Tax=Leucosporidium creatinivorum TaxID=106004 RepID=A0A1Y2F151_9BASI|nr:hypothetical protein BCR35DRAFT_115758 [Leucosporidium creatinivorum]